MHDAIIGERLGLPALAIVTEPFADAAALMARALGAPDYRFVTVPHPVSSAGDDLLAARARAAASEGIALLTGGT